MSRDMDIDGGGLRRLVSLFYSRVREDTELGSIFNGAIADRPAHLEKLVGFWSSLMLTSGRYKGNPVTAHTLHKAEITPALFSCWLALWEQTTAEIMSPAAAAALQAKAARIAESLQLTLFFKMPAGAARSAVFSPPRG